MSLVENQTYRKKVCFTKQDENKEVSVSIGVKCDHEIDKNILKQLENLIQSLFNNYNYKDWEAIKAEKFAHLKVGEIGHMPVGKLIKDKHK